MQGLRPHQGLVVDGGGDAIDRRGQPRQPRLPDQLRAEEQQLFLVSFGSLDFQVDLGIEGDDEELLFFRSQLVWQSRLAGLPAPIDGVATAIDDKALVQAQALHSRRLGFGARLCIHPRQLAPVHEAFTPGAAERTWATRVLAALEASGGAAVAVDGRMVDRPVWLQAQRIANAAPDGPPTRRQGS